MTLIVMPMFVFLAKDVIFVRYMIYILRKTIEGYSDSVPSLTSNTVKTLLIMHAFHSMHTSAIIMDALF